VFAVNFEADYEDRDLIMTVERAAESLKIDCREKRFSSAGDGCRRIT